jgi:hypothetical protein
VWLWSFPSGIVRQIIGPYTITHEVALGQQKTDENVGGLLILPQLQAAIDAMPSDNLTFTSSRRMAPRSLRRALRIGSTNAASRLGLPPKSLTLPVELRVYLPMVFASVWPSASRILDAVMNGSLRCWGTKICGR